ncbi:hypothetical protein ACKI1K_44845, partial [Streptomyces scabiei]|uniref:hypothetical protein n=2 Tax=Bacteria TaxID=2 RepID=UPI0038F5EAA6
TAATSTFSAKLAIDPKVVQQGLAQADVVVGEISRKPVTLDAALVAHAKDVVSGTIEVTIDADSSGKWNRIATVLRKTTKKADGAIENET